MRPAAVLAPPPLSSPLRRKQPHEGVLDRLLAARHPEDDLFAERKSRADRIAEAARTPRRRKRA